MKRYTCALTALAASLALALPSAAAEIAHFGGETATAEIYDFDEASCISTSVYVFVTDSWYKNPPAPAESGLYGSVGLSRVNECTFQTLACAYGNFELPGGSFDVNGNLASATLNLTVDGFDCQNGGSQPIAVNITWTGDGEVFNGRSSTTYSYPGYSASYRTRGKNRYATLSGSVTAGAITVNAGSTSAGYTFGQLTDAQSGTRLRYE